MSERLQKFLARSGLGSRRQIEDWIRQGRISVNGKPAQLGMQISGAEKIHIDGKLMQISAFQQRRRVLAYYKPVGEVTTRRDPEGRPTVFERVPSPRGGRWITVGRLDLNTQGLLLLTNDGELANRLMHPSSEVEREYAVRVLGEVGPEMLQRLRTGVTLEDGPARFDDIREAGGEGVNHWYHVILREGRNREVRRLWESQGVAVSRLIRVRYGPITLRRGLHPGRWDELDDMQLKALLEAAGYPVRVLEKEPTLGPRRSSPSGKVELRPSRGNARDLGSEPRRPSRVDRAQPGKPRSNEHRPESRGSRPFAPHGNERSPAPEPHRPSRVDGARRGKSPQSESKPESRNSRSFVSERTKSKQPHAERRGAAAGPRRPFTPGRARSGR